MSATNEPYSVALVDLDGTIIDSAPGITTTLAETLVELGLPTPPPSRLLEFVGPPILDGFRDLVGLDAEQSQRALAVYRQRYRDHGAYDATPYPGIRDALVAIRDTGLPLAVATSKPEGQAKLILQHFGLIDLFVLVAGASDDERRSEKADVITWGLGQLAEVGVDTSRPVMIGDRIHDVEGAAQHGIPTIFAEWGYGTSAEAAGAVAIAAAPEQLRALIAAGPPA